MHCDLSVFAVLSNSTIPLNNMCVYDIGFPDPSLLPDVLKRTLSLTGSVALFLRHLLQNKEAQSA